MTTPKVIGKRHSTQRFGGAQAILGASVFVTTSEGGLLAGHVHHIIDTVTPPFAERVFVAFATAGGWDDDPRMRVLELPFFDPKTREEADAMPPEHWCWPRTWEAPKCPCQSGKAFADCHGAESESAEEPRAAAPCDHEKVYSDMLLTSDPPQRSWICAKCKALGNDTVGAMAHDFRRYDRLMQERANLPADSVASRSENAQGAA